MERLSGNVLVVADTPPRVLDTLTTIGLHVTRVADAELALKRLSAERYDVVLTAASAGDATWSTVEQLSDAGIGSIIVAVGDADERVARRALRAGASEYVEWPADAATVAAVLRRALLCASRELFVSLPSDAGLLGSSPQLSGARAMIARAAPGTSTVLVRGETGTGKDLAARALHAQSQRGRRPFVKVHTPAVPDALLESELFGYERGAFTGATTRKPGRVELAEGGTLFLDEIGEISPTMQAKLLRLLQDREYERLGGTRTLRADIRVVAATHRDLEHLVHTGAFREDLFYRLNVVTIWIPPLRARREDIAIIAEHYLARFCSENDKELTLDAAAHRLLAAERWPGNVRQLVNFVERLVVLASGRVITAADVQRELAEERRFLTQAIPVEAQAAGLPRKPQDASPTPTEPTNETFASAVRPLKEDVRRTEQHAITKALRAAHGNRALAARLLGVSRRTLYTKLEELGIE
jgi:two-component system, NtrC family, response regulator AtoC